MKVERNLERKWNANGTRMEREWNANGTQMDSIANIVKPMALSSQTFSPAMQIFLGSLTVKTIHS